MAAYTNHVASKGGRGGQGNVHVCLRRGEGGLVKSSRSFLGPDFSKVVGRFREYNLVCDHFFENRTKKYKVVCDHFFRERA